MLIRLKIIHYLVLILLLFCFGLTGCAEHSIMGHQYQDGYFASNFRRVSSLNLHSQLSDQQDIKKQIDFIEKRNPTLYLQHKKTYQLIQRMLRSRIALTDLNSIGLRVYQLAGDDHRGNVLFTGYYTPVLEARRQADSHYRYPLYAFPREMSRLPSRAQIYNGALNGKGLEIAYTRSLLDNFFMSVQGSGYVDFGRGQPLSFFAFAGKNGYPYRSIGKILVARGEVPKNSISMQAIKAWSKKRGERATFSLLAENPAFVFFHPMGNVPVMGASGVPLVANASAAADNQLIPQGSVLLVELPILSKVGRFTGKYELRLVVTLDVGGAIKGHHLDLYQGIGSKAGHSAGHYNHYGRVWLLTTA